MKFKQKTKSMISVMLAAASIFSAVLSPAAVYASDMDPSETVPLYEDVKDLLDEDEVVKATDLDLEIGSTFDVSTDFTGLEIKDKTKVTVTFEEAKNESAQDFTTDHADIYKAVYYVEPVNTEHPKYQISRKLIVKEAADVSTAGETGDSGDGTESGDEATAEESDDGESDSIQINEDAIDTVIAETDSMELLVNPAAESGYAEADQQATEQTTEASEQDATGAQETAAEQATNDVQESEQGTGTGAAEETSSEQAFDEAIEEAESQDTVDPETGLDLQTVLTAASEQDIALTDLEEGETVTYSVNVPMLAAASTTESVTITRGSWYYYADYGLGSYVTAPYYVKYGDISATAYCVQPSRSGPDDGTYKITKLGDGKKLAKVCYYGTKASGDEGFFAVKHPDFSTGKRFIITHLAAAYANGSSDAFSGTNSTGQSLAMELYNYCMEQPEIPDVEMSFSSAGVEAYVDGNSQRTPEVTFQADELQSVTFKLPSGVKLHNITTGKTSKAGASVEISGGTKFYLSAPLTQAADVSQTFSIKMKGSITKDYSAYKITTGSASQDLAFVFGEGTTNEKYVSFSAKWVSQATVAIVKKDADSKKNLAGAVYGIYSDKDCTKLITEMPATDANGASSVSITRTQDTVYLKEISVPTGYLIDAKAYNIKLVVGQTTTQEVSDKKVSAKISLIKKDKDTGKAEAQGDATLEGAVYGLYARADITKPDGSGTAYKAGDQVATLTTDKNGQASINGLYLGKYYIKEISAPTGYLPDTEEHDLACDYEGNMTGEVSRECTSFESVVKQPFQIIKAANNGKTDADLLEGVGFSAWLVSSLKTNADGTYDFSSADPVAITADGKTEMFTDAKGYACSIALPYGTYIVRETTSKHNFTPVDDFTVTISENKPDEPQVWKVLLDKEFEAKLKVIKKDGETKQTVLVPNAEFRVYDVKNKKYVEQVTTYPKKEKHTSYFTDEEGYLILPNTLKTGTYRIEEVTAPEGYTLSTEPVTVEVDSSTAYLMDADSKDAIIEVEVEDTSVKGALKIFKQGEVLTGFKDDFIYEERGLSGVTFEVYAKEDIYTADHQKDENGNRVLKYAKDSLVAELTTDADGYAEVKDLPLGIYYVKETGTVDGYVLSTEEVEVTFAYEDQNTPVIEKEITISNERQKVSITVEKQDLETGKAVKGAVFGLYNTDEIKTADGKVLFEADSLIGEFSSDADGLAACTLDLPLGKYYVKETKAPDGYLSSDKVLEFDASYRGADVQMIDLASVKKNQPTTVEVTKSDLTTGVELSGAYLSVMDKDGNVVDHWISDKDTPHVIKCLKVGETYTLREELAPNGYLKATEIEFTIKDTAEVQKVEMKDEVPTGKLVVNKKGEFLDTVSFRELFKGFVEHVLNYISGEMSGVTFEVYAEEDIKAEDGTSEDYYKADELVATITTDEVGIAMLAELPLGKYYVKEVETAHGYVLDGEIRHVDLSYVDQNTPVVTYDEDWQNNRQTASINILKKEKGTDATLKGAMFGLYTKKDIKSDSTGKVLVKANEPIEVKTTDKDGKINFTQKLPVDAEYYVKEISAPDGYVNKEESKEFTFTYDKDAKESVTYDFTFEDAPTKVEISKQDIAGKEVPGAELTITDSEGNVVEKWTSTEEPHYIEKLPVGKYTLHEVTAPDGYQVANDVEFEVTNTEEIQKVVMVDEATPSTTPEATPGTTQTPAQSTAETHDSGSSETKTHPKTGDDTNIFLWVLILGCAGCSVGAALYKKRKGGD